MKTNVSIKFNSIEEYREIERVLEGLGYVNDKEWNEEELINHKSGVVSIDDVPILDNETCLFTIFRESIIDYLDEKTYNSLEEFLKD